MKFLLSLAVSIVLLSGCTSQRLHEQKQLFHSSATKNAYTIEDIPAFKQVGKNCGPTSLASLLNQRGAQLEPSILHEKLYIQSLKGTLQRDLVATTREQGYLAFEKKMQLRTLTEFIQQDSPVLVLFNMGLSSVPIWHYAVVGGYDIENNDIQLYLGQEKPRWVSLRTFEKWWHGSGYWGMVAADPERKPAAVDAFEWKLAISDLLESGHLSAADIALETFSQYHSEDSSAYFMRGNIQYLKNNFSAAEQLYRKALNNATDTNPIYINMAWAYLKQDKVEAAREIVDRIQNEQRSEALDEQLEENITSLLVAIEDAG